MSFKSTPAAGAKLSVKVTTTTTFTAIGGLDGIPEFGPERAWIESTSISDTAKSFVADMADPGEQSLAGQWDSKDAGQIILLAGANDATAASRDFKAEFTSGASATFSAIIGSFRVSADKGQTERFGSKIRLSGAVSYTPAT